jgi:hypothetical protein
MANSSKLQHPSAYGGIGGLRTGTVSCTSHRGHRARSTTLVASALAGWGSTVLLLGWVTTAAAGALGRPGPARPEDAVALLAGGGGLLITGWLAVATLVTLVAVLRPRSRLGGAAAAVASQVAPRSLRRTVALVVGVGLLAPAPALAATPRPAGAAGSGTGTVTRSAPFDPGWAAPSPAITPAITPAPSPAITPAVTPAVTRSAAVSTSPPRPSTTGAADLAPGWVPRPAVHPARPPAATVVVRRGDCLWDIAARHLGPAATTAAIAAQWPRWYAANREVIGPRPDLLRPGQRLHPPDDRAPNPSEVVR